VKHFQTSDVMAWACNCFKAVSVDVGFITR